MKYPCVNLTPASIMCHQDHLKIMTIMYTLNLLVEVSHTGINSRGARVSFGLWILKVKGPTLNLDILNPEVVLIPVWGASF